MLTPWLTSLLLTLCADGCPHCEYTGMVPCKEHSEELHGYESRVLFCSYAPGCERCQGTLLEDCRGCEDGPRHQTIPARRQAIEEWLTPNALERHMQRSLPRIEAEHFVLVVDTDVMKDGKKRVDPHVLAHRLADDVEHVAARVAEHYDVQPGDYSSKMEIWIFKNPDDHSNAMMRFLRNSGTGNFKLLGQYPKASAWTERPNFSDVPRLRALTAHNAGHMLVSNLLRPRWTGDIGGGWLDAAAGHWYEYELLERTTNYCVDEAVLSKQYARGQWRAAVKKRLKKEQEPLLPGLLPQRTGQMAHSEHALVWSFYDYLVAEKRAELRPILADLKNRREAREIFRDHLDGSVLAVEEEWRTWVEATYPSKGDKPRNAKDSGKR